MSQHSKEKVYTKRPLCVVYYGVDFSFDGRQGGLNFDSCSFACTVRENQVWKATIESCRFWEEDDYGYEIVSVLILSALAWTNVTLAGKRDSRHHSTTSFSERRTRRDLTKRGGLRIDDFRTTTPLDCVTGLLRMLIWALAGVAPKSTLLLTAIRQRPRKSRTWDYTCVTVFLYISLPSLRDYDVKWPKNLSFFEDGNGKALKILLSLYICLSSAPT